MASSAIDTIVFDLGNVLIHWDPRLMYRTLFEDVDEMERFLKDICNDEWNVQMDAGRPFADGIAELVERYPEKADLIRAYRERWHEMLGGPIMGSLEVLMDVHSAGHRLIAITNWSNETFPIARERYNWLEWFAYIAVSGELGMVKPDPAIFRHTIQTCGLDPARTIFIDDSLKNVEQAARMGFATHWFRRPVLLKNELLKWGVVK